MAVELATAYVSLVPSARGISSAINRELSGPTTRAAGSAGASASKAFGGTFSKGMKVIGGAVGGFFAFTAVTRGIGSLIGAAEESIKVGRQTSAVLKSTGGAANVSAGDVSKLATALSLKSGVDDELIQSGANVLLTFTNIRNEVGRGNDIFNQATVLANDMSVALGQDLKSSNIQLGKALNDPIKGLTALRRVGVAFTAQQEDQIKTLVESGDTLGAQKIILAELSKEFGGSAAAQATATSKLRVAFGNIAEQIGGVLLPYVNQFSDWMLTQGIPLIQTRLVPQIAKLAHWISTELAPAIRDEWLPAAKQIGTVIKTTVLPVLERLGDGFLDSSGALQTAVVGMGAGVKLFGVQTAAVVAKVVARWAWMGVQALLHAAKVAAAWLISMGPIGLVIAAVAGAAALIVKHWDTIQRFVTKAARAVVDFLRRNWPLILGILTGPIGLAVVAIIKHWEKIKGAFTAGVGFVKRIWSAAWDAVWSRLQAAWRTISGFFAALPGRIRAYFVNAVTWLLSAGHKIIAGLIEGITNKAGDIKDWFLDLPGKIWDWLGFGSPPQWAIRAGEFIVEGFIEGLGRRIGDMGDLFKWLAKHGFNLVANLIPDIGQNISGFVELGKRMAAAFGWTGGQFEALRQLWTGESGWNPSAYNPSSGASGIPQALPASKMGPIAQLSNPDIMQRAAAQIAWGLGYIRDRYGDPISALQFWNAHTPHWYEKGAWEVGPGGGFTHPGEMVLPTRLAAAVRSLPGGPGGPGGGGPVLYIGNFTINAETEAGGRAAGRGFLDTLAQRQIMTDARIA